MSDQKTSSETAGNKTETENSVSNGGDFGEYNNVVCSIIPPLNGDRHKGQSGRIGLIGGSVEYTGAPYFSAISSMKTGADLSYVFSTADSAPIIKSYSPELVVYPFLDQPNFLERFNMVLPKLHTVVIGPGLGRDDRILASVGAVISILRERCTPIVLDADALYFVAQCPEIVRSYTSAILTPNVAEFDRLFSSVFRTDAHNTDNPRAAVELLAKTLGHITILRKGPEDIISNGITTYTITEPGSPRRCGGQGDLLSGAIGTFGFWSHSGFSSVPDIQTSNYTPTIVACLGASMLIRRCSRLAFSKFGRSMVCSDMIPEIKNAFSSLFPID